jgi:metal-responsive CopG/Arc/MetJ family transcriptional regulator
MIRSCGKRIMVTRQIELTEEQAKALDEVAATLGRSVSELIRDRVDDLLRDQKREDPEEVKRRAIAAIGRFRSGVTDLSREHYRYLDEAFGD